MDHRIELGGHGCLEVRSAAGEVVFVSNGGEERRFAAHPLASGQSGGSAEGELRFAIGASGDRILLGLHKGRLLHLFDVRERRFSVIETGERLRRVEEMELIASGDLFIVVTENGIAALAGDGGERWRIDQTTYGWQFVGEADGAVWLSDTNGNLIGFDCASGIEASL